MPQPPLFPDQGLPIRRLGVVTHATAILRRENGEPHEDGSPKRHLTPITLPAQIPMGGGWQLQHGSPTSGQVVKQNWLVPLFHDNRYLNSIRLHTFDVRNIGLLDSIAAVFDHLHVNDHRPAGYYGYAFILPQPVSGAGGTPNLLYYRPIEAPHEQYLLLYDSRVCMYERPGDDDSPSFVNLYALVQVEFDEEQFVFLLRQALAAAERAN